MSDDDAYATFKAVRFAENEGKPFCPSCGIDAVYEYRARRLFKCKACEKQFTVTSGTTFRSHKMSLRDILVAIAIFANGVNGHSALRLSRDLNCAYKTAFVLAHKLRRAMATMQADNILTGDVDIDGLWIGGHLRPHNMKADRVDGRREYNRTRKTLVTMRERRHGGRSRSIVVASEHKAVPTIKTFVHASAIVTTDEGSAFDRFYRHFAQHLTVNHSQGFSINGVHNNPLEAQHSRIRSAERGVYMKISSTHCQRYADELSWRDDFRRVSNGQQFREVLKRVAILRPDAELAGYWQKRPRWLLQVSERRGLKELTRRRRRREEASRLARKVSSVGDRHRSALGSDPSQTQ